MTLTKSTTKRKFERAELQLFHALYKYRVLSTEQVRKITGYGKKYVYVKLKKLTNWGYIFTEPIKGTYKTNQARQGNYYRLATKGIAVLREYGYSVLNNAHDLRVSKDRLQYLLVGHDLSVHLEKLNWIYKDSREVKQLENVNRGDIMYGTITNPEGTKEFLTYVLLQTTKDEVLNQIYSEANRVPFEDILIITRGKNSFESVVKKFTNTDYPLIKGGSLNVLPHQFAMSYLPISTACSLLHKKFIEAIGVEIILTRTDKNLFGVNVDFEYLVKYKGEEFYFMDLLDNDLMKMRTIREYNTDLYKRVGKKVLVLTSYANFHRTLHMKELQAIRHVEFLPLNLNKVVEFAENLFSENVLVGGKR